MGRLVKTAISEELYNRILEQKKNAKSIYGVDISQVKASRVIAYKDKVSKIQINLKKLLDVIGGRI